MKHDPEYAQYLVDKWFWRNWRLFSIITGSSMDYLTDLEQRPSSFKEFTEEWIIDQFLRTLDEFGLQKPWYWDTFLDELDIYHHMVYASAYTYRATLWFNCILPSPAERKWLRAKYRKHWGRVGCRVGAARRAMVRRGTRYAQRGSGPCHGDAYVLRPMPVTAFGRYTV
jgi:toluene monooxygenase system protein A